MPSKREITLQYDLFFNIPGNKIWIINILVQLQDILILKLIVNFIQVGNFMNGFYIDNHVLFRGD